MMKKIHLISLTSLPHTSAESIHIAMLANSLNKISDFKLVSPAKLWRPSTFSKTLTSYGIEDKSFRIDKKFQFTQKGESFIRKAVKDSKYEKAIVYCREGKVASQGIIEECEVIWEQHALPSRKDLEFLDSAISNPNFLYLIVISKALKDDIMQRIKDPKAADEKILVLPDGADISKFSFDGRHSSARKVGYIGSSFKGKGLEVVLPLSKLFKDVSFEVYGVAPQEIDQINSNLTIHGKVPFSDVPNAMQNFDIALLPNQPAIILPNGTDIGKYTSPMKMFEYMAAGKAIIASDLPILREVLIHNHNALLVPHNDLDAWRRAVDNLIRDPQLYNRIRVQGYNDLRSKYTYDARCRILIDAIDSIS